MNKIFEGFWKGVANLILNHRLKFLGLVGFITVFMGIQIAKLELSYELPKILPQNDDSFKIYENFKKQFGEDGNVMVIAIESEDIYKLDVFNGWYDLTQKIKGIDGIKNVLSVASLAEIKKNEELKKFEFKPLLLTKPASQSEVDSLKNKIGTLPFYEGLVYQGNAHIMAVTFDQTKLNSKDRITLSKLVESEAQSFGAKHHIKMHFSGMPFIRTNFMSKVREELSLFMGLAFLVTTIILYLFFKSLRVVFYSITVIIVAVIWAVGLIALFGYKISILTGMIPPLIIVIGIPNSIFLINKYQEEYLKIGDKMQALSVSIEKIGKTTFIANVTTFIGFFVFYFTGSPLLLEFGLVAAIAVVSTWAISLILIPTIFSYVSEPKPKHVQHLENKRISNILKKIDYFVHHRRTVTYWVVAAIVITSVYGATKIKAIGYVVDDLPEKDPIFADLKFVEKNFKGIVPFEVMIDTKEENGVFNPAILSQIRVLQREFSKYPEFTKPLSIVEGLKFVYQGYRGGDTKYFVLPPALELQKMAEYVKGTGQNENMLSAFLDSKKQKTRVSFQSADVGTVRMREMFTALQAKADTIFNFDKEAGQWKPKDQQVDVRLTGNGVVFTKGNDYLLGNLGESTLMAIILVSIVMASQFLNFRTVLISTIPSIIPLIITAGIMGYFGIPLKPSTTLIFSIAFGIASDGTIYFLTKYKEEILKGKTISQAVSETIKFTGISMFYTAIILFFGFGIFVASGFKGTVFLGLLVSITLLIGMISNLILLPCFLMTLDKRQTLKQAKSLG
ncbi:MAG TPA: MMPL family transporter [Leadbetterella sp.]|nr:MMPL family transporter [Leadbetterella sp.]